MKIIKVVILVICSLFVLPVYAEQAVQTFLVSLPEQDVYDAFDAIEYDQSIGTNMRSITSLVIAETNTVVFYDQWEDGYESEFASPTQSTSVVWGDGNTNNGYLTAYPSDVFSPGDVIELDNYIPMPRDNGIYYDGRDKISVTKPVALTRAMYPDGTGPLMAGAVQALDTTQHGVLYESAVGEDISYNNTFDYVGMFVMASENPTLVKVDTNGDDVVDIEQWLESGENLFIDGGISVGATVSSEKPIQAHLVAGKYDGNYKVRLFTLFPKYQWTDRYYTPVGSTTDDGGEVAMFIHNPNSAAITVNYETATTSGSLNVAANGTGSVIMPADEAGYFYTSNGDVFVPLSTISGGAGSQAFDWGFSPVPQKSLSTMVICAWGWGSSDKSGNYNPFWVTATTNTTLYIDYDSDPTTGAYVDSNGNYFDASQVVSRLESVQLYNTTTNDQTRMRVYTLDGTFLNGAWGEYPGGSTPPGGTALDMGTTIMPFPAILVKKSHEIWTDVDGNGKINPGDSLKYILTISNHGFQTSTNIVVYDKLPDNVTYNSGTFIVDGVTNSDDTVPPALTEFPLDENGYNIGSLDVGETSTVSYVLTIDAAFPIEEGALVNSVYINSSEGQRQAIDPVRVSPPDLNITKVSSATNAVVAGDTITYTITVSNDTGYAHSSVRVNDTLPSTLAYVTNSTKYVVVTNLIQQTVKDNFSSVSYSNNDGSTNWLGDWNEYGENNGPATDYVSVDGGSLGINIAGRGIWRMADLSGYSNATFKFTYRRDFLINSNQSFSVYVSPDGGGTWTVLDTISGTTNDPASGTNASYDISSYISTNTAVWFLTGGSAWDTGNDWVYFDGVQIEFTKPGGGSSTTNNGSAPSELVLLDSLPPYSDLVVSFDATVQNVGGVSQIVNQAYTVSDISQNPIYASATDMVAHAIGDLVWEDMNGNGIQDAGESGISNVTVRLYDDQTNLLSTTTTDSSGNYQFDRLLAGDYYIEVVEPSGYAFTVQNAGTNNTVDSDIDSATGFSSVITLSASDNNDIDAGLYRGVTIGDYVWFDTNEDGIQDTGEPGSNGVQVLLYVDADGDGIQEPGGDDGPAVGTNTTYNNGSNDGYYEFTGYPPGDYYVKFVLPYGAAFTIQNAGSDDTVDSDPNPASGLTDIFSITSGSSNSDIDAGLVTADMGLGITKESDTGGAVQNAGDTITYTITVENTGTVTLAGINITDILPAGVTYVANSTKVMYEVNVTNTVRDEFNVISYANQDGTVDWANDWQEINESNGATNNAIAVANKWGTDYQAKVVNSARGLWREADLSGYDTATLSFDYMIVRFDNADAEETTLMVSSNGNSDWVELQSWTTNVDSITSVSYDISSYISGNTALLFTNVAANSNGEGIQFDNIQIEFIKNNVVITNSGGTPPNLASGYSLATGKTITVTFDVTVDGPVVVSQLVNTASASAIGVAPVSATVTDAVSSSIGNRVWNDLDGDGVQDSGEPGIENVTMKLYTNGVFVTSVVTDSNGEYLFTNLLAGTYTVIVDTNTLSTAFAENPTYDRDGTLDNQTTVTVTQGGHITDADFGYDEYPTLVVVSGFSATTVNGEVVVAWDIELEVGTIGYYLERQMGSSWVRVNEQLISRPPFENTPPPYHYSVVDSGVKSGETHTWRIVELDNQGRLLTYGPYTVTVDGADISYETWAAGINWNGADSSRDGDADGDGLTNFEEYLAGTDPLDANSLLQITGLGVSDDGDIVVRWQSASGIVYSIEMSTTINGNWLPVTNGIQAVPPDNVNTITIDNASASQMFFRVIAR